MTSANMELHKAIYLALSGDAALIAKLGGPNVYDHVPAAAAFPYVTFGQTAVYDWSTDSEIGDEHLFTIHVWSRAGGKKQVLEIMDLIATRMSATALTLDRHRLVNLALQYSQARNDDERDGYHGLLRYRAVTEGV
ncbi:DUF3168 domain-containing protein [Phyllobacterium phragmitis]|uniref:DUF3168 domain-containing protein n=1 Tax=Phyllobacterium phragmitis TaxID=2670329 RepID=A0A2S9IZ39_9HYPH|nr:DUF3168 domain-containing protein [Phyllobacterium phragmitis]PRD45801.1 DUF3168 domain-containing protein [Phyllobacterium phragmitis]